MYVCLRVYARVSTRNCRTSYPIATPYFCAQKNLGKPVRLLMRVWEGKGACASIHRHHCSPDAQSPLLLPSPPTLTHSHSHILVSSSLPLPSSPCPLRLAHAHVHAQTRSRTWPHPHAFAPCSHITDGMLRVKGRKLATVNRTHRHAYTNTRNTQMSIRTYICTRILMCIHIQIHA